MVLISARSCIKAGVSVIDNPEYPEDCNILRQKRVQFECQLFGIKLTISVKVSIEIGCVHPSIGSTTTYNIYLFTQQGGQRLLKSLLYSRQLGLKLPSAIVGAVIGKMYKIARQFVLKIKVLQYFLTRDKEILYILNLDGVFNMVVPHPFATEAGEESATFESKTEVSSEAADIGSLTTNNMKIILR